MHLLRNTSLSFSFSPILLVSDEVQTDRAEEIELRRIGTPAPFVMIPYPAESDMVIPSQQNHMSDSRGPYNPGKLGTHFALIFSLFATVS